MKETLTNFMSGEFMLKQKNNDGLGEFVTLLSWEVS